MKIEDYYRFILEKVKNPDFVTFTNDANEVEKRKMLSVYYSKINIEGETEPVSVFSPKCERKYIHGTFKRIYNDAVKWAESQKIKGLEKRVESQPDLFPQQSAFERHLAALDGYNWNKNRDYPSLGN